MPGTTTDKFEETFAELRKWADTYSPKYLLLTAKREKRAGRLGSALKVSIPGAFEWMLLGTADCPPHLDVMIPYAIQLHL